eukprot:TRINITY_DN1396_c0_g1_i1.p1 TRINITY_DN1396_c0_g1~~TRINITY_DN1396_c0_g1_i1.p1  ORF type:complete len:345 (+),score=60.30 TRINITY_DN1396_c0_g1_i1:166-1200(+)
MSFFTPTFLTKLSDPSVKNIFITGCGGGFDFVHSMILYPELKRLGKNITIGSYSFGDPTSIKQGKVIFEENGVIAKKVTATSEADRHYGPEVNICSFLDKKYPDEAPHFIYAYYARDFTVPLLTKLYTQFTKEHSIDTVLLFDGGNDSLMAGDENGLGDPIEDCVSLTTAANLSEIKTKILFDIGFGSDRFINVSDSASMRAISELKQLEGFLGSVSIEKDSVGGKFYSECIAWIYENQSFRSVLTGMVLASMEGKYGFDKPSNVGGRVSSKGAFVWPLMSVLWAFDIEKVIERNLVSGWIKDCKTVQEMEAAFDRGRTKLQKHGMLRNIENFPRHEDMRAYTS